MTTVEDFKAKSQELLVELDAATSEMMTLICVHQMTGTAWKRQSSVSTKRMSSGWLI